jgi:hypothetical protein
MVRMTGRNQLPCLSSAIGIILGRLMEIKGFAPPIRLAAIAANGSLFCGTYTWAGSGEELLFTLTAEHYETEGFKLPVHILFTNGGGVGSPAELVVLENFDEQPVQTIQ